MFKIICLCAILSAVAANTVRAPSTADSSTMPLPQLMRKIRAPNAPLNMEETMNSADQENHSAADDMDKAETFGFGYHHKHIYVQPYHGYGYYPGYHHGYYPSYGYNYAPNYGYNYGYPYYY